MGNRLGFLRDAGTIKRAEILGIYVGAHYLCHRKFSLFRLSESTPTFRGHVTRLFVSELQ